MMIKQSRLLLTHTLFPSFTVDDDIELMDSDDDDEQVPLISVGDLKIPITELSSDQIAKMTPTESDAYIQVYQDYYDTM